MKKESNHIKNITEAIAIRLFNRKFGDNFWTRWEKVKEEFNELNEVIEQVKMNGSKGIASSPETFEHLDDEICDLYGTITHFASIRGLFHRNMLDTVVDKVITRETNPDYKRFEVLPKLKPLKKMVVKKEISNGAGTIIMIPGEVVFVQQTGTQNSVVVYKIKNENELGAKIIYVPLEKLEPIKEN
jgi:hypothetical protein